MLTTKKQKNIAGEDPNYAKRDLFNHLDKGGEATWTVGLRVLPFEAAESYKFNIFDVTKVIAHKDYPFIEIGKLVLNRNPINFFAEVEQSAFSPSHLVPGIEASPDKVFQGRLFSYPDTHRYRLGTNYLQIPINRPYRSKVVNFSRDGLMNVTDNGGASPVYNSSYSKGTFENPSLHIARFNVSGSVARTKVRVNNPEDDFVQAGILYRDILSEEGRKHLIENMSGYMKFAKVDIQRKCVALFSKCDEDYGKRLSEALGLK